MPREPAADPGAELARLDAALEATRREVQAARESVAARTGEQYEAGIFDAHLLFLADEALLDPARRGIREGRNAADAWDRAVADVEREWQRLTDSYQRERVRDLDSLRTDVLGHLLGTRRGELGGPGIVVAGELTPADTAGFDPAVVRGIATASRRADLTRRDPGPGPRHPRGPRPRARPAGRARGHADPARW